MASGHHCMNISTPIGNIPNTKTDLKQIPKCCQPRSKVRPTPSATSTATLARLPNELLVMIARDAAFSEEDLSAFSRTCRSIRIAITRVFYTIMLRRKRIPILHWAAEHGFLDLARHVLDAGADPSQFWYSTKPKYILSPDWDAFPPVPSQDEFLSALYKQPIDAVMDQCGTIAPRLCRMEHSRWADGNDSWMFLRLEWAWEVQRAGLLRTKYGWMRSGYLEGAVPDECKSLGKFKWTPLHLAVYYGHHKLVKLLLGRGSDPDLASAGLCTCTKLKIRGGGHEDCDSVDIFKWTAIHLALCRSQPSFGICVKILDILLYGSVDNIASRGLCPSKTSQVIESLAIASIVGDEGTVKVLLDWIVAQRLTLGCPTSSERVCDTSSFVPADKLSESNNAFLLEYGIVHCAIKSHHWDIVERLAQASGPDHSIMRSLESLLGQSAGNDLEACVWLVEYGVKIQDRGRFLRAICPAPTSSIYPHGQPLRGQLFEVVMHTLKQCTAADINAFGLVDDSQNALGRFMAWHFSQVKPSEAGDVVIRTMLGMGGDPHLKNHKSLMCSRKESNLTPLSYALKGTIKNTGEGALDRFHHFLQHQIRRAPKVIPEGEYLHKFFVLFGHGSLEQMPDHTLVNIAQVLILWGAHPEERDTDGETSLFAFLHYLRVFVPAWIGSKHRPNWLDEITYLLACLQKCGASLVSANSTGRTAEDELGVLRNPAIPLKMFPRNLVTDHEEFEKELRRLLLYQQMKEAIRIVKEKDGTPRMKFRRPRTAFEDLSGDDFIQLLLRDDELWWS